MDPPGHKRDLQRAESQEAADLAIQYLRTQTELFIPSAELARAIGVNPNRLGHVLRRNPSTFQVERTYKDGGLITVVALRPGSRSSSSSANY